MEGKSIYLDYAATTPTHPDVVEAMLPYFTKEFGNPSSLYTVGRNANGAVEDARDRIASFIGADPKEIVFTSGGTESDNFAIKGTIAGNEKKGNHIITTRAEHHAVLEPCHFLEKHSGKEVTYLQVNEYGTVDADTVRAAIKDNTVLVSIMHANNEVGTISPIEDISKVTRELGVYLHTDAVQTVGHIPVNVNDLGVDLLSSSAHKFYGPKGVGFIYIRRGTRMASFMHGGAQEKNRRAGTHNVAGIVGMAKAIELAEKNMRKEAEHLTGLRDYLISNLKDKVEGMRLNGHPTKRLPNNVNACMTGAEGEAILLSLDMEGVSCSSGSACTSGTLEPSHVLLAMGVPAEIAHSSLRFTLGRLTTKEEIDYVLDILPSIITRLRAMSPLDACWGQSR
ncbi:MAG: cysteine desulfurase NifS [Rubrobacteridae bacterium]|nr:cysteine desulfurase NifS [Rubrobacteridae bacterium]